MSNPFCYVELHTADPEKAKAFYRSLFDWKTKDTQTPFGAYTEVQPGEGTPAGLRLTETPGVAAQWITYIAVSDVAQATERAKTLGARPLREIASIPEGRFSVLADPTGAVFGLFEQVKRP